MKSGTSSILMIFRPANPKPLSSAGSGPACTTASTCGSLARGAELAIELNLVSDPTRAGHPWTMNKPSQSIRLLSMLSCSFLALGAPRRAAVPNRCRRRDVADIVGAAGINRVAIDEIKMGRAAGLRSSLRNARTIFCLNSSTAWHRRFQEALLLWLFALSRFLRSGLRHCRIERCCAWPDRIAASEAVRTSLRQRPSSDQQLDEYGAIGKVAQHRLSYSARASP